MRCAVCVYSSKWLHDSITNCRVAAPTAGQLDLVSGEEAVTNQRDWRALFDGNCVRVEKVDAYSEKEVSEREKERRDGRTEGKKPIISSEAVPTRSQVSSYL